MSHPELEEIAGVPEVATRPADMAALDAATAPAPAPAAPGEDAATGPIAGGAELPPKRRRRRRAQKPQEATTEPEPAPMSSEDKAALQMALATSFRLAGVTIARLRGRPHWNLADEEVDQLAAVWGEALAPYMSASGKYMPFAIAGLVTVGVIMPRIERDGELDTLDAAAPAGALRPLGAMAPPPGVDP